MNINILLQNLSNGISLGCLFALIAIGYTMVYGVLRLINYAHGSVFMMAIYFVYYAIGIFFIPWWLSCLIAVVLAMLLGMIIEIAAYKPLRNVPRVSSLCAAIGVGFFLENFAVVVFGGRPKAFYRPEFFSKIFVLGEVRIPGINFATPIVFIISFLILNYIIYRTKTGLAVRAVSEDFDTAKLMGINLNRTISLTFIIGSGLAGVGAILWASRYPLVTPFIGGYPGISAFIASVIGGIGNIRGATLGGFLVGILGIMVVAFLPELAGYKDVFIFVILIFVLLFKPEGLFGEG